jgi:hypothetical protein
MGLSDAYSAFDEQGWLRDELNTAQLRKTVDRFIKYLNITSDARFP